MYLSIVFDIKLYRDLRKINKKKNKQNKWKLHPKKLILIMNQHSLHRLKSNIYQCHLTKILEHSHLWKCRANLKLNYNSPSRTILKKRSLLQNIIYGETKNKNYLLSFLIVDIFQYWNYLNIDMRLQHTNQYHAIT